MTALLLTGCAVAGALAWGIVRTLLGAEAVGWIRQHCRGVVERQAGRLPVDEQEISHEIWLGELAACEDRPLTALWWVHVVVRRGCIVRVREVAAAEAARRGLWRPRSGLGQLLFDFVDGKLAELELWHVTEIARIHGTRNPAFAVELINDFAGRVDQEVAFQRGPFTPELKAAVRRRRLTDLDDAIARCLPGDRGRLPLEAERDELLRLLVSAGDPTAGL